MDVHPDAWDRHQIQFLHKRYQHPHKSSFKFSWMSFDGHSIHELWDTDDDVPAAVKTKGL